MTRETKPIQLWLSLIYSIYPMAEQVTAMGTNVSEVPFTRASLARRGRMNPLIRENRYSGLRHYAKVHSFRIFTVILAWVFIAAAFYEKPELLTWIQRAIQGGMEIIGDKIPPPWGPRIEFVFREIGGFIWLQITLIVVVLRVLLSGIASVWRLLRKTHPPL